MILIMSVEPGLGGQKYMEAATDRIIQTRKIIKERGLNIDVEVDGGVCKDNLRMILDAGADFFLTGDKDFLESSVSDPRIISVAEFLDK